MSFEPLKRILSRSVRSAPMSKELRIAQVFDAARFVLERLWGTERSSLVVPLSFREGTLKFETSSPAAKQQMLVERAALMNEINRRLGERIVTSIVVQGRGF
jgi:predicted nucleic acid-binding Zn ribbon protein